MMDRNLIEESEVHWYKQRHQHDKCAGGVLEYTGNSGHDPSGVRFYQHKCTQCNELEYLEGIWPKLLLRSKSGHILKDFTYLLHNGNDEPL